MGVKWTDEQKQVIDLRGRNLLVSAAAGSGKTAVLVERIIERVVDPVHPVDIDRMLIVTFTRAAAGEMKDRIGAALQKRLEADPANDHLQKQGVLLHHAQISTIHGFCTYVIRNYFHRIDLDPAYRVGEQGELQLLRNRVMKDMLEEEYTRKDAAFVRFMDSYARGRTDERAEKLILGIYDFAMSAPDPDEWLDSCCRSLAVCSDEELSGTAWMQSVMNETRLQIEGAEELYEAALMLANDPQGPADVVDQLTEEQESIYALTECFSYASMAEETGRIKFPTLRFKKNSGASPDIVERVKDLRNAGKKIITNIQASPFCDGTDAVLAQCAAVLPAMEELVRLVKLFRDRFSAAKRDKNLMDFSDLEHFALQILLEKAEDGTWKRTAAAKELAEHFEEIMTDEYQDSNQIQEVLLNAVSRNEDGGSNRFMVGDMKQSIYGFRMARPQLFLDKYDRYPRWNSEGDGDVNGKEHVEANDEVYSEEQGKAHVEAKRNSRDARIDLNFNFRSRREVLDCANALFEKLMIPSLGGILYDDAAALHCRASYPEPVNPDFPRAELILLNKTDPAFGKFNNKDDMTEAEAATVAAKIRAMVGREMVVDKETGEYRPLEYRDCVVLLRSASSLADAFVRVLRDNGIPAFAASREGYFSAVEVVTVLNYLRLIDNPLQDIPYAAVLRSPIGGLNDGELAQLRAGHRDVTLAEAVKLCIGAGEAERGAGSG
ncbi:MAG: UvrD-helicase domain-containing protein, partial [Eubacterium sp.]|nr:UvrD-helicase domain-containing protein [Eubacterium sp.]